MAEPCPRCGGDAYAAMTHLIAAHRALKPVGGRIPPGGVLEARRAILEAQRAVLRIQRGS